MRATTRVPALLVGAAAAGVLIWFAGRFDNQTQHDYWISIGLIAAAGLALGLAHLQFDSAGGMIVAIVAVCLTIWVVLAGQPAGGGTVRSWSHSIGIGGVVHDLAVNVSVLAFASALLVGTSATAIRRRRRTPATVVEPAAAPTPAPADEPFAGPVEDTPTVSRVP